MFQISGISRSLFSDAEQVGYPVLKAISTEFNTTLLFSAAVERLLSVGGQIETSRRSQLSDSNFEKTVAVKGQ